MKLEGVQTDYMAVSNVEVYGIDESVAASHYPMQTDFPCSLTAEQKDFSRADRLSAWSSGEGHNNWLCGVIIQFDLRIPIKMWTEFERYHFADIVSSESTMHRLKDMDLGNPDNWDPNTSIMGVNIAVELQEKYQETKEPDYLDMLLMSCPVGLMLTARISTNYRQLKTIYHQRKDHRLQGWKDFCSWIGSLPESKWITEWRIAQ